jgi:uncharacterized membrane protein (DUF485 family)
MVVNDDAGCLIPRGDLRFIASRLAPTEVTPYLLHPQNKNNKGARVMTPQEIELIRQHPDFIQLVRRKQKLYWSLSLAMLVIYYGFVLLVAFSPSTLGQSLSGGVTTVGMLVGVVIVGLAFALTGFYVYRANNVIDPLNEKLKQECAR